MGMSKKFTDLSQLTKAILKKDMPQSSVAVTKEVARAPIPHPVKAAPEPEVHAETPSLSQGEAACLAYFSHTSITDRRFATAGRVQTSPAPRKRRRFG